MLMCLILLARVYYLQVYSGEKWQALAQRQHRKKIVLAPQRGTIFDRNGEPLALSLEADSVYVDPVELHRIITQQQKQLQQDNKRRKKRKRKQKHYYTVAGVADNLARVLHLKRSAVLKKVSSRRRFVWIKRRIDDGVSKQLHQLKLPGIHYIREHVRWYPNGRVAGQIVGFTGLDNRGLEGLERRYNGVLAGDDSYLIVERDGGHRGIGSGRRVIKGRLGQDIYLTIDKQIEYIVEKELAKGVKNARARSGSVIVLEPSSGRVLAMASYPDYDPNYFRKYPAQARRNRAVCDAFEPGSTFKTFMLAAALDTAVVKPGEIIDCGRGVYRVGGKVIHDHAALGKLTVTGVLQHSSNIGSAKIAQRLGRDNLYRYLRAFGFGQKSGIDFDGDRRGLLRPPQRWFDIDLAAISFGQGVSVTPVQLVSAIAAIANGGNLYRPHLVERIVSRNGDMDEHIAPYLVRRVIKERTAHLLTRMMVAVTADEGTGSRARVPGFVVAGKTGTAQKVDPVTGTYSVDKRVSSFVGFAPADNPRLVVLVVLDEPHTKKAYGGLLAAPVFARIVEQALRYMRVPPSYNKKLMAAPPLLDDEARAEVSGVPTIAEPLREVEPGSGIMPDCRGLDARQVLRLMAKTGINIKIKGTGRVVKQFPPPGNKVHGEDVVWVRLQPPR